MSLLKAYKPGAFSAVFAQGASAGGGFLAFFFLANMLTKDDFGAYSFAFNVMLLLSILATLGLDRALLLKISGDGVPTGRKRGLQLVLGALGLASTAALVSILLIWAASAEVARSMESEVVRFWLNALAPAILPMTALLLLRAWFQANHRMVVAVAMPGLADLLRALLIGLAFVTASGKTGVALAVMAAFSIPVIALLPGARRAKRDRDCRLDKKDVSRGLVYAFQRITEAGLNLFDVILIGLVASDATTAEFALAARLAALADTGRQAVTPTFLPRARLHHTTGETEKLAAEYAWVQLLGLLASMTVGVVMILFGPAVLSLFGGFEAAFAPLVVLISGFIVTAASGPHLGYLTMTGEVGIPMLIRVGGLVLTALGLAVIVPVAGTIGAAFVIVAVLVLVNAAALSALWTKTGFVGFSAAMHGVSLVAVLAICAMALGWINAQFATIILVAAAFFVEEAEYGAIRKKLMRSNPGK